MSVEINSILKKAVHNKASDVHIKAGSYPIVRIHGALSEIDDEERLSPRDTEHIAMCVLNESQREEFKKGSDIDIAYSVKALGRFRCNCYVQRGTVGLVFRFIPPNIMNFEELSLPVVLKKIAMEPRGLVLVTGTTGSGKSTTLASMIDYINSNKSVNIVTIEDPIEFLHKDKKSIISQREVGTDTENFAKALRAALRQDPDVILVGEMRDFETVKTALDAAETGHLVVSTLHTIDAVETINRVISMFPPYQHHQVRAQLSSVLRATISMRLVPHADNEGMVPAVEVLVGTTTIRECILDPDKTKLIRDYIAEGVSQYGMQTFDQSLFGHFQNGLITYEEAVNRATNPDDFALRVKGVTSTKDIWGGGGDISKDRRGGEGPEIERFSK
jgi:twitching motility protein PilT